ncbi:MAG: hypothetical protein HRU20_30185 [Pseudomonadales bacterium]|nr:hypothetical protein [Pseudomonadales bacterium]
MTQDIAVCADPDADLVYNVAADDMPGEIIDNCPDRANASQNANVCADPDGDKLFNAAADNDSVVDACPTIVNPGNNPAYCEDSDGDGVYNLIAAGQTHAPGDNCPNGDGNGAQMLNADQTDDDGDGIGNICDGPGFVDNDNDLLDDNTEDTCVGVKRADNNPAACTDTDGDLVMNLGDDNGSASDNCPTRKNASQNADVCADPDGDTVFTKAADDSAEVDDNCPAIPNADQAANIGFQVTKGDACDNEDNDATVDLTDPCPVEGSVTDCANQDLAELWDDYYIDFMCWANKVDGRNSCAPPDGLAAVDNRSMTCPGGGSFKWNVGSDGKNEQIWSNCTFTLGQVDYRGAGVYPATHTVTVNGSNLGMMDACASCDDQGTGQINGNYTITATYSKAGKTRTYTDAKVKEDRYVYRKKVVANDHVKNAGTTLSQTDCVETSKGCVTGKVIYDNNDTYTNSYNGQQAFKLIFPGTTDAANL